MSLRAIAVAGVLLVLTAGSAPALARPVSTSAPCAAPHVLHLRPGQPVRDRVAHAGRGRTICFSRGTYRLTVPIRPLAGQRLIGTGATLSGSRVLSRFTRSADGWTAYGQTQQGQRNGVCAGHGIACTYPDDVLVDGAPLRRVLHRSALRRGSYFFDYRADTITLHDDPHGHRVEAMVAPAAIVSRSGRAGADVTVRGFSVEDFATMAQHGAIETSAPGWVISRNTVRRNHGAGITTQGHVEVLDNVVERNGQLGIGGVGRDTLVEGNDIGDNNTGGFDPGWEAGGAKWALTDHLVVRRNRVHDNLGPGLWNDIDAQDTTYAGNVVTGNSRAGIFDEISGPAVIEHNVVRDNGHGFSTWLWGAGILLAGSHDARVRDNRLSANAEGIALIQQARGRSSVDGEPRTLHDIAISDNHVAVRGGDSGAVTDDGYQRLFTDPSITWRNDRWTHCSGHVFAWNDTELTVAQWRRLGHDV